MIFYDLDLFHQNAEVSFFQNLIVTLNRNHKMEQKKWKCWDQNSPATWKKDIPNWKLQKQPKRNLFCSLFFNIAVVLRDCNFIKKILQHRCFPMKFGKIKKKINFEEHLRTAASKFIYYTHVLLSLDVMTYYVSYDI